MPIEYGTVVLSLKGRDKGNFAVILAVSDTAVLVADGKQRPLENPKSKNRKHISAIGFKLTDADIATNKSLRRALTALRTAHK